MARKRAGSPFLFDSRYTEALQGGGGPDALASREPQETRSQLQSSRHTCSCESDTRGVDLTDLVVCGLEIILRLTAAQMQLRPGCIGCLPPNPIHRISQDI